MKIFDLLGVDATQQIVDTVGKIDGILNTIIIAFFIIGALAMVVYAIYIAFKLGSAEDDGKRKEMGENATLWASKNFLKKEAVEKVTDVYNNLNWE